LAELTALPVDYWALGHVHSRRVLSEKPFVVYSGCTQGKDIHEPGVQGCFVVDCDGTGIREMTFHPTSVLEFETVELNISDITHLEKAVQLLSEKLSLLKKENDLLFRLKLTGVTVLDADLRRWNETELYSFFYNRIKDLLPGCFLETVFILTQMPGDERSALFPAEEVARSLQELTDEKFLEKCYDEMRTVYRALPPIRSERFEELRRESCELLSELLTGKVEFNKK
jgi:DNA repair exonuclease SbcCD nuclease subunit